MRPDRVLIIARAADGQAIRLESSRGLDVIKFLDEVKKRCSPEDGLIAVTVVRRMLKGGSIGFDCAEHKWCVVSTLKELDAAFSKDIEPHRRDAVVRRVEADLPSAFRMRLPDALAWLALILLILLSSGLVLFARKLIWGR